MENLALVSNERLVKKLQEGLDEDVLSELIQRFNPMVKKYSSIYSIPNFDYDDFHQEAKIVIYKATQSFDPDRTPYFAPFVHTVYRNHLANILRHHRAARRGGGAQDISLSGDSEHNEYDRLDIIADTSHVPAMSIFEIRDKSATYFSTLSPFEKKVFRRYLEHDDYQLIASELNISLKKVNDALYRCRKKLKSTIN